LLSPALDLCLTPAFRAEFEEVTFQRLCLWTCGLTIGSNRRWYLATSARKSGVSEFASRTPVIILHMDNLSQSKGF
jgi:hypothetical protein